MKIELKNFGPIHHFTFDLDKDLHVIYGENNVGKSYAIGAVYLILKNLYKVAQPLSPFGMIAGFDIVRIVDFIRLAIARSEDTVSITDQVSSVIRECFERYFLVALHTSLQNSFSSLSAIANKFNENAKPEITIRFDTLTMQLTIEENRLSITSFSYRRELVATCTDDEGQSEQINFNPKTLNNGLFHNELRDRILQEVGGILSEIWKHISSIYFLPASRTGLYESLSGFGPVLAKLSQVRSSVNGASITLPTFAESVSDYFLNLSTIKSEQTNSAYSQIAQQLEKELINAEIIFNPEKGKLEYYNKSINLRLNLSETSSMVSEIAPIVAHFKYILDSEDQEYSKYKHLAGYKSDIQRSPLLFIEEPEAHLHPKVQVKMMEIFAKMIKVGIKVVMTTHSDFMLSKLTNLLLADEIDAKKVASYHIIMGKNGSYDAENMKANEEGIEDYNFIDVTEQLYEERINLLEKQNSNASN